MRTLGARSRRWLLTWGLLGGLSIGLAAKGGAFLLVDAPLPAQVILVLAGETDRRPERALELLAQGYGEAGAAGCAGECEGSRIHRDSVGTEVHSGFAASRVGQCMSNLRTVDKDESKDAEKCLAREGGKSVLIVTSDFHTRRALKRFPA